MSTYIYVSSSGEDKIAIFSIMPETSALKPCGSAKALGSPAQLAVTSDQRTLIVGLRASYQIATFRIDASSGVLRPNMTLSLDSDPDCLTVDRSGRFLFSTYPNANILAIHAIDLSGKLFAPPAAWLDTEEYVSAVRIDRSNRFAFLLQPDSQRIAQCLFDEQEGKLRSNDAPYVSCGQSPSDLCFHPFEPLAYVSDEAGNIMAYRLHPRHGRMELMQEFALFPAGFPGLGNGSRIAIAPNGRMLFSLNREQGEVVCATIDSSTNQLSSSCRISVSAPRDLAVAPSCGLLFVLNERGTLHSYRIQPESADVIALETLSVGKSPCACVIVRNV